jgi:hypothetical protein
MMPSFVLKNSVRSPEGIEDKDYDRVIGHNFIEVGALEVETRPKNNQNKE